VALKAIEIYLRDRIVEKAAERAGQFQARLAALNAHPLVGEARGLGLIGGVELVADKVSKRSFAAEHAVGARAVAFAEAEGLIVRVVIGDVLTLCPPLIISAEEVDALFDRLTRALDRTLDWVRQERLVQG
jgi:4-aminobutyrate--pyruvate transaminase